MHELRSIKSGYEIELIQQACDITEKGFETGRANFIGAESDLASAPGQLENPATSAGSTAGGAASSAMQGQTDIANADNAWIAPVAGMIGSLGSAAVTGGFGAAKKP